MGRGTSCKTAAAGNLLSRGRGTASAPPTEQGAVLADQRDEGRLNELARCIRERDREDQQLANVMLAHAVEKGRWLTEAKAMVPYGEWGNWLKEKVDYSQSKAQGLMKLYQKFGDEQASLFGPPKSQTLGNLSVTKALMLIDIPDEELEEIMEGNDLESMTTREVAALKRDLADAKAQAKQAQADQTVAEQARAKMAEDMAFVKRQLEMAQEGQSEALAYAKERQEAFDASEREVVRLAQELETLRSRPVEVAVESDPAAIEAARKEAEAAMQDKLNEARAAQEKARADLEQTRSELEGLRAKAAQAEKKASLAANEDLLLFRTLFDQTQELSNKMSGVLLKVRNKDPEKAAGLSKALMALSEKIRGVAAQ